MKRKQARFEAKSRSSLAQDAVAAATGESKAATGEAIDAFFGAISAAVTKGTRFS
ncbi:nucleoid DNA-binding protein [Paraburkholderia sp. EB58]|jgi:hypothetical protein